MDDTKFEQLNKQLFKLMREQTTHVFNKPAWIRIEAEIDAVNDQINNYRDRSLNCDE